VEIKPDKHEAWYNLGNAYAKQEEYDQAIKAYRKALSLQKDVHLVRRTASGLMALHLYLSQKDADEGNQKRALGYYKKALNYLPQAAKNAAQDVLVLYLKKLFKAKAANLVEKALDLIKAKGKDWVELLRPYREALRYLETKDKSVLNRLFPEIRQIVEQLVAQVEGEIQRTDSVSTSSTKMRKKRRRK
jgi:tetratricopeptide (TPR) repeat protein